MHTNMRFLWICSSILFQEACGANLTAPVDPSVLLGVADKPAPTESALAKNLDWALAEFEKSMDKTKSASLKAALQDMLAQYNARLHTLEQTLAEYDQTAKEAAHVLDHLSTELIACRAQENTVNVPQNKTGQSAPPEKVYDQLYRSYLTLKPQFQEALKILQNRFPGFQYDAKKFSGLADQFATWEKRALPSPVTTSPPPTSSKP